jgi:hypothetical protein
MDSKNIFGECVLFHPGIGKTGTSAIQSLGIQLPADNQSLPCFSPFGILGGAHNVFAHNHPNFKFDAFVSASSDLIDFCLDRSSTTVVSSEFLIRLTQLQIAELVKPLIDKGLKVKAVFSIRNYDSYLSSSYMQAVKVNWGKKVGETLADYCSREIELIRYHYLIDRWAQLIGDENIYLMDYDKYRENFVSLFFNSLGIDIQETEFMSVKETNTSIPLAASTIMDAFDTVSNDMTAREKLVELVKSIDYVFDSSEANKKIIRNVVKDKYSHDFERLSCRYKWVEL